MPMAGCDICTHTVTVAPPVPTGTTAPFMGQPSLRFDSLALSAHTAVLWAPAQSRAPPRLA
jgi:hypothetical protein